MRDLSKRRKLLSIPVAEYDSFSHQPGTVKADLIQFSINFFLNITLKLAHFASFLISHIFTVLAFDSYYQENF